MVGEVSPDGNFVWDGEVWVPKDEYSPSPEITEEAANNVSKAEEENFFLVQAYTFALEVSHSQVLFLRRELVSRGVEE